MKQIILSTFFIMTSLLSFSQDWKWSKNILEGRSAHLNLDADPDGNTYFTVGIVGVLFGKYNIDGAVVWKHTISSSQYEVRAQTIKAGKNGACYVGIVFQDTILIDSKKYSPPIRGKYYSLIIKFDVTGLEVWSHIVKGIIISKSQSIALDSDENVYVTGGINDTAFFPGTILISKSNSHNFLAKFSVNGDFKWAKGGLLSSNIDIVNGELTGNGMFIDSVIVINGLTYYSKDNNSVLNVFQL
jgi:hypothetical protein